MSTNPQNSDSSPLRVRRARVDSVDLYEVKDSELDILEKGSPAGLQLNFAIFLLSIASAFLISLLTTTFTNSTIQTAFIVVTVVGFLGGLYLLLVWWGTHKSISSIVVIIRKRMIKEVQESQPTNTSSQGNSTTDPTKPVG